MKELKEAQKADTTVVLRKREERTEKWFAELGKSVYSALMRKHSLRKISKENGDVIVRECVVRGC